MAARCLRGLPVSGGLAFGTAYLYRPGAPEMPVVTTFPEEEAAQQLEIYKAAIGRADEELGALHERLTRRGIETAEIMAAQREILEDEEMDEGVQQLITEEFLLPAVAVNEVNVTSEEVPVVPDDFETGRAGADLGEMPFPVQSSLQIEEGESEQVPEIVSEEAATEQTDEVTTADEEGAVVPESDEGNEEAEETKPDDQKETDRDTCATYVVSKGDTLYGICMSFYGDLTLLEEICSINEIEDMDNILCGQKILLPRQNM